MEFCTKISCSIFSHLVLLFGIFLVLKRYAYKGWQSNFSYYTKLNFPGTHVNQTTLFYSYYILQTPKLYPWRKSKNLKAIPKFQLRKFITRIFLPLLDFQSPTYEIRKLKPSFKAKKFMHYHWNIHLSFLHMHLKYSFHNNNSP